MLRLVKHRMYGGIDIIINDQGENVAGFGRQRSIKGVVKEKLANRPIKYALKGSQRYLSIGYDFEEDHLTLTHEGVDVDKLPPVENTLQIFQNKIVDTSSDSTR